MSFNMITNTEEAFTENLCIKTFCDKCKTSNLRCLQQNTFFVRDLNSKLRRIRTNTL